MRQTAQPCSTHPKPYSDKLLNLSYILLIAQDSQCKSLSIELTYKIDPYIGYKVILDAPVLDPDGIRSGRIAEQRLGLIWGPTGDDSVLGSPSRRKSGHMEIPFTSIYGLTFTLW